MCERACFRRTSSPGRSTERSLFPLSGKDLLVEADVELERRRRRGERVGRRDPEVTRVGTRLDHGGELERREGGGCFHLHHDGVLERYVGAVVVVVDGL